MKKTFVVSAAAALFAVGSTASAVAHAQEKSLVIGTNNWGFGGFELYHEAGIRTAVKKTVTELALFHDQLWKGAD